MGHATNQVAIIPPPQQVLQQHDFHEQRTHHSPAWSWGSELSIVTQPVLRASSVTVQLCSKPHHHILLLLVLQRAVAIEFRVLLRCRLHQSVQAVAEQTELQFNILFRREPVSGFLDGTLR